MRITREWLFDNQTDAGSWTQDQLECVGVQWPPKEGWIVRILGNEITEENARRFEQRLTRKQIRQLRHAERQLGKVNHPPDSPIHAAAMYLRQLLEEEKLTFAKEKKKSEKILRPETDPFLAAARTHKQVQAEAARVQARAQKKWEETHSDLTPEQSAHMREIVQ